MANKTTIPSSQLPEYFQADLAAGTSKAHPMLKAIDECVAEMLNLSQTNALSVSPEWMSDENIKEILSYEGFVSDALNEEERRKLFEMTTELFAKRNTIGAISLLADLYFPFSTVQRGLPLPTSRAAATSEFMLSDTQSGDQMITVRLTSPAQCERIEEFVQNAAHLLPDGFVAKVLPPKPAVVKLSKMISLSGKSPLTTRRL